MHKSIYLLINFLVKLINKVLITRPNIIPLILVLSYIPYIIYGFINNPDWDLYNNLYFGNRLLKGELLWEIEFHDKFPILQYIFAFPALFKSLFVWRLISFTTHIISSLLFYKVSILILKQTWGKCKSIYQSLAKYIGIIYFISPFFLNGFTHFSNTSSNLFCISFSLIILKFNIFIEKDHLKNYLFWVCLILTSIASSIRPYYIPVAILFGFWIPLRAVYLENLRFSWVKILSYFLSWNILLFLITILINFLPYIIRNNIHTAVDGIILNSQDINPQSIKQILISQLNNLHISNIKYLLIIPYGYALYLIFNINKRNTSFLNRKKILSSPDFIFLALISPLLLQIMIMNKHYWSHYSLMFLPFISFFSLGVISIYLENAILNNDIPRLKLTRFISFLFIIIILFFESFKGLKKLTRYNLSENKSSAKISKIINDYSFSKYGELSFIDFTGQRIHLYLNKGRAGFPHPAHIKHLENSWYKNTKIFIPDSLKNKFPLDINSLFSNLIKAETKIVIVNKNGKLNNYLNESELFKKNKFLSRQLRELFDEEAIIYERIK